MAMSVEGISCSGTVESAAKVAMSHTEFTLFLFFDRLFIVCMPSGSAAEPRPRKFAAKLALIKDREFSIASFE